MNTSTLVAPAKLTLGLRITGVRPDGYHLIDAVMTTLELHDTLTVTTDENNLDDSPSKTESEVTYLGPFGDGLVGDGRDLVSRALVACNRSARVQVRKAIPHGGGLGGGSADAAAIFRWAGVSDLDLAATIGADVPFCIRGGRARVRGIGEIIEPMTDEPGTVTLVIPPISVSTPLAYRAWDELGGPSHPTNDLEPAALKVEPALATWKAKIAETSGIEPTLAGSGATWFLLGDHGHLARDLPDARVIVTRHR
ncbi:MAG: 4-(cytidine 5'-diphospho)-2-C-methyl-D-erythritol kinase [Acidimicrobiales bacterium mtb01]|nr:4-(cytidine 5'-diphospho)-2-C-methyl-D-erythritol kinase [Actinomycetota bacterium]TEX46014.1 MAG: 4-(cytidine 5'-diphospho)-2-C-methyl-D-erythritol kinase [Acidimicrobiales bacterium mtb01]